MNLTSMQRESGKRRRKVRNNLYSVHSALLLHPAAHAAKPIVVFSKILALWSSPTLQYVSACLSNPGGEGPGDGDGGGDGGGGIGLPPAIAVTKLLTV